MGSENKYKYLILGCNGMAGHMITIYLKEKGHNVLGFARKGSKITESVIGNARNTNLLTNLIQNEKFDVIVNCIGILNQSAETNKAEAVYLNSYFPHFIADTIKNLNTQLIHLSTDCVFSGDVGSYCESDIVDGRQFYDRTKALGEINDSKNITFRNSIIGPDMNPHGIGLLNWFLTNSDININGYNQVYWTGQTTLQLARVIEAASFEKISGLFHMVPDQKISKYELLKLFNHYFFEDQKMIIPSCTPVCDKSLKRTNFSFDYHIPDYELMIKDLAEWMKTHQELYPHYYSDINT